MRDATRVFFRTLWLQAVAAGLTATALAALVWSGAPAMFTAIDWGPYDAWTKLRRPPGVSPHILLVIRDQTSEQQFGAGLWDRSVLAHIIGPLHDAGAAAIGIDIPLDRPSPPHLGGAVSDALLLEAMKAAGTVAYPVYPPSPGDNEPALDVAAPGQVQPGGGFMLPTPDPDRVVRRIPLSGQLGTREFPAFGMVLAAAMDQSLVRGNTIPTDARNRLLVNVAGDGTLTAFHTVTFLEFSRLADGTHDDQLVPLVKDKAVILLAHPRQLNGHPLPTGIEASDGLVHMHLLNTLLTRNWIRTLPSWGRVLLALVLASGVAYLALRRTDSKGLLLGAGLVGAYVALIGAALTTLQWTLPIALPISASAVVLLTASLLGQIVAGRRVAILEQDMLHIQQDLSAVREALVCRETTVETLEEDLESARVLASQSASKEAELLRTTSELHNKILDAQKQEEVTRRRMEELERQLSGLRAAATGAEPLSDLEQDALRRDCEQFGIVTRNAHMLAMFRDLKKGARSTVTVLLMGEPGTGKELFARAVHRLSPRAGKPFIAVNMAAISPELFESELFGHVRGSFTGALADRKGYFELAHQGTIFLDEIGDLRLDHQSKLLRVLQDRTFYRVGAASPTTVDVRIVAATNKDLQRGVSEGWFREDLYFRLKGLVLTLSPLRERPEDLRPLVDACLRDAARVNDRARIDIAEEALATLARQRWNEQAAALCEGPIITSRDLRLPPPPAPGSAIPGLEALLPDPVGDAAVLALLRRHGFDMQTTARALGWDRSTVTQRLKGLCFQALVDSQGDKAQAAATLAGDPALTRTVELKLLDYYNHLLETIQPFATAEEALLDCKRRFKNLPERHFRSVEALVRQRFRQTTPAQKT